MIKLTAFYPFLNFLRVTQEFYEDKASIKIKALDFEREFEFNYEDVGEISDGYYYSSEQSTFSFFMIMFASLAIMLFWKLLPVEIIWKQIAQVVFISGIILYLHSFIKIFHILIYDKDGNFLVKLKQNNKNQSQILQIIENIKSKSNKVKELKSSFPFPSKEPVFEYTYYNSSDLQKQTDKFFEDRIIGVERGLYSKTVNTIMYDELSQKMYKVKSNTNFWGFIGNWCILFFYIFIGFYYGFNIYFGISLLQIVYTLLFIFGISCLISLIKREIFGFYHKKGGVGYWAYINKKDKDKVEKIIEYVKSRIPEENNESTPLPPRERAG